MNVACPNCQKETQWNTDNQFRPFCSERCKLIDLGEWASEGHVIKGSPSVDAIESIDSLADDFTNADGISPEDRLH